MYLHESIDREYTSIVMKVFLCSCTVDPIKNNPCQAISSLQHTDNGSALHAFPGPTRVHFEADASLEATLEAKLSFQYRLHKGKRESGFLRYNSIAIIPCCSSLILPVTLLMTQRCSPLQLSPLQRCRPFPRPYPR